MTTKVLSRSPLLPGLYAKAAAAAVPGAARLPCVGAPTGRGESLPDLTLRLPHVTIDSGRVARYRDVCGFSGEEHVPATYLHVLAFPLQLALMTDPSFPFTAMGLVHIGNTITQHRQLTSADEPTITVAAEGLQPHPRGRQVTLVSTAEVAGATVWRDETVLLSRGRSDDSVHAAGAALPAEAPAGAQVWRLPGGLGRRYAAVSGDRNPIHLYDVTAKAFGFKRHIVHGMWTKARALAELERHLPEEFTVSVAFKKPIWLPGQARFGVRRDGNGRTDFGVTSLDGDRTHLLGRVTVA
ncbi:MAG: MaoC family dehydratase [Nocardioidaceae bacterium]